MTLRDGYSACWNAGLMRGCREVELVSVVGTSDHWAAGDVHETNRLGFRFVGGEFLGRRKLDGGQMRKCRWEILAESQDIAAGFAKIGHGFFDFRFSFAEAEHDAA